MTRNKRLHRTVMVRFLACVLSLSALDVHATHYLGFSVAAHVPLTLDLLDYTHNRPALGGEVGMVYEWHYSHLMLHTGLDYAAYAPSLALANQTLVQHMTDTRDMHFDYHGSLRNRTDRIFFTQVALPLMVGATWNGIYGLIGPKIAVNLGARADIKAELQTEGDYLGRYYDWFVEMPNHGYHDYEPVSESHNMTLNRFDVRLAAEVGFMGEVNKDARTQIATLIRFGLFLEYGLLDMRGTTQAPGRTVPGFDRYMYVTMTHPYATEEVATPAHLLTFGLRFSVLFPLSASSMGRRKCNCYGVF